MCCLNRTFGGSFWRFSDEESAPKSTKGREEGIVTVVADGAEMRSSGDGNREDGKRIGQFGAGRVRESVVNRIVPLSMS
jgi:hypothetical protein